MLYGYTVRVRGEDASRRSDPTIANNPHQAEEVRVKPPGVRCEERYKQVIATRVVSDQVAEIDSTLRHVRHLPHRIPLRSHQDKGGSILDDSYEDLVITFPSQEEPRREADFERNNEDAGNVALCRATGESQRKLVRGTHMGELLVYVSAWDSLLVLLPYEGGGEGLARSEGATTLHTSDHETILMRILFRRNLDETSTLTLWQWEDANWEQLQRCLGTTNRASLLQEDVDQQAERLTEVLLGASQTAQTDLTPLLSNHRNDAMDQGRHTAVLVLGITGSFDRVWHAVIVERLHAAGVAGALLELLHDYLQDARAYDDDITLLLPFLKDEEQVVTTRFSATLHRIEDWGRTCQITFAPQKPQLSIHTFIW
ncbi:hypothetical protein E2C01_022365 [Portunus trituberculatus]|uniref:Uncharacterized protein n=1 Tax=Portunus trituberculatus TaxID=210409 RepID=A0A5B7E8Q6_PORTR|nr:hypothetical protein [Portunus trituberculatus]